MEKLLMDSDRIGQSVEALTDQIFNDFKQEDELAIIGIKNRGEVLADRIVKRLKDKYGFEVPVGAIDITLHRDDINQPGNASPKVFKGTTIPFDVDGKIILLVDDVVFTGRSCRAAIDGLVYFGRPRLIRLAVLVDRGHREFPIQPDYVGERLLTNKKDNVMVNFVERDQIDRVILTSAE